MARMIKPIEQYTGYEGLNALMKASAIRNANYHQTEQAKRELAEKLFLDKSLPNRIIKK